MIHGEYIILLYKRCFWKPLHTLCLLVEYTSCYSRSQVPNHTVQTRSHSDNLLHSVDQSTNSVCRIFYTTQENPCKILFHQFGKQTAHWGLFFQGQHDLRNIQYSRQIDVMVLQLMSCCLHHTQKRCSALVLSIFSPGPGKIYKMYKHEVIKKQRQCKNFVQERKKWAAWVVCKSNRSSH